MKRGFILGAIISTLLWLFGLYLLSDGCQHAPAPREVTSMPAPADATPSDSAISVGA